MSQDSKANKKENLCENNYTSFINMTGHHLRIFN